MADLDARWSSARSAQAEEGGGAMLTGIAEVTRATGQRSCRPFDRSEAAK
jgi:hypothetical protein